MPTAFLFLAPDGCTLCSGCTLPAKAPATQPRWSLAKQRAAESTSPRAGTLSATGLSFMIEGRGTTSRGSKGDGGVPMLRYTPEHEHRADGAELLQGHARRGKASRLPARVRFANPPSKPRHFPTVTRIVPGPATAHHYPLPVHRSPTGSVAPPPGRHLRPRQGRSRCKNLNKRAKGESNKTQTKTTKHDNAGQSPPSQEEASDDQPVTAPRRRCPAPPHPTREAASPT